MSLQQIHTLNYFLIGPFPPTQIGLFFRTFNADGQYQVTHPDQLFTESFIYQGAVGKR